MGSDVVAVDIAVEPSSGARAVPVHAQPARGLDKQKGHTSGELMREPSGDLAEWLASVMDMDGYYDENLGLMAVPPQSGESSGSGSTFSALSPHPSPSDEDLDTAASVLRDVDDLLMGEAVAESSTISLIPQLACLVNTSFLSGYSDRTANQLARTALRYSLAMFVFEASYSLACAALQLALLISSDSDRKGKNAREIVYTVTDQSLYMLALFLNFKLGISGIRKETVQWNCFGGRQPLLGKLLSQVHRRYCQCCPDRTSKLAVYTMLNVLFLILTAIKFLKLLSVHVELLVVNQHFGTQGRYGWNSEATTSTIVSGGNLPAMDMESAVGDFGDESLVGTLADEFAPSAEAGPMLEGEPDYSDEEVLRHPRVELVTVRHPPVRQDSPSTPRVPNPPKPTRSPVRSPPYRAPETDSDFVLSKWDLKKTLGKKTKAEMKYRAMEQLREEQRQEEAQQLYYEWIYKHRSEEDGESSQYFYDQLTSQERDIWDLLEWLQLAGLFVLLVMLCLTIKHSHRLLIHLRLVHDDKAAAMGAALCGKASTDTRALAAPPVVHIDKTHAPSTHATDAAGVAHPPKLSDPLSHPLP